MVASSTKDRALNLPDPLIRAVTENAHRRADLVTAGLRATRLFDCEPPRLPAAFLLEFSAMIELGVWEHRGLRRHLRSDLPSAQNGRKMGQVSKNVPTSKPGSAIHTPNLAC